MPVEIPPEPQTTLIPKCILVERCGGCCKHESLKCVPTEKNGISTKKMEVLFSNIGNFTSLKCSFGIKVFVLDSSKKVIKTKQVVIEKHNKCNCVCKVLSYCNGV